RVPLRDLRRLVTLGVGDVADVIRRRPAVSVAARRMRWVLVPQVAGHFYHPRVDDVVATLIQCEQPVAKPRDAGGPARLGDEVGVPADDEAVARPLDERVREAEDVGVGHGQRLDDAGEFTGEGPHDDRRPVGRAVVADHDVVGEADDGANGRLQPLLLLADTDHPTHASAPRARTIAAMPAGRDGGDRRPSVGASAQTSRTASRACVPSTLTAVAPAREPAPPATDPGSRARPGKLARGRAGTAARPDARAQRAPSLRE